MAGLLDFLTTPESQLGIGLLAAAGSGQGFGPGLLGATQYAQEMRKAQAMEDWRNAQVARQRQEWEKEDAAQRAAAQKRAALPGLFGEGNTLNWQQALAAGYSPDEIQKLAQTPNAGRAKVARTVEGMDEQGRPVTYQVDEFGQRVGDGIGQWKAPQVINQGDRQTLFNPATGQTVGSFGINMSPSERDASARGWASNNLARERLQFDMNGGVEGGGAQSALTKQFGKAPPGYRWKNDGTVEAIPGGPADIKAGEAGAKAQQRADAASLAAGNVLDAVSTAKELVGPTTAGVGSSFANIPGTNARDLQAKLETVKANLGFDRLQQMREMSPTGGALGAVAVQELIALQSTVASLDQAQSPAQLRKSLDKVQQHYNNWLNTVKKGAPVATEQPAQPAQSQKSFSMLPNATQYDGKRIQGPDGTIYRSSGGKWVKE